MIRQFINVSFLSIFIKKSVSEQINLGISKTYTKTSECLPPKMSFTGKTIINIDYLTYLLPDAQTASYTEEGTDHL